jgi:MoaA/NifB/PqqE/SkfB family radical SAM enzyme
MLQDQRNRACSSCWTLEDQGFESERIIHNQTFDHYLDRDIELIQQDAVAGKSKPQIIKIATSNVCNGTCVTCGSNASSAWASLEKRQTIMTKTNLQELESVDWREIVQLSFVGGEPLLEKKNFSILQNLIDVGNTNCFISIVTNGSIELNQQQIKILSSFENLNFCFSIDAVGDKFEYLRYPLKWNLLLDNLKNFRTFSKYVSVSCMVSNISVFYLDETIDFFHQQNINYLCKQINNPVYFAPGNLPPEFKQKIENQSLKYADQVLLFLKFGSYRKGLFNRCWQELDRQDSLKRISIKDYLPEVAATRISDT